MRKFFALALAVAMVMSLASVSFAVMTDTFDKPLDYSTDGDTIKYNKTYDYSFDGSNSINNGRMIEYGDTAYFALVDENGSITDYDRVEKLRVKAEFEMGEDLVESISIVKKPVKTGGVSGGATYGAPAAAITANEIEIDATDFTVEWTGTAAKYTYNGDVKVSGIHYLSQASKDAIIKAVEEKLNSSASNTLANTDFYKTGTTTDSTAVTDTDTADAANAAGLTMKDSKITPAKAAGVAVVNTMGNDYFYFLAVKIKKVDTTADADIIGTFQFKRNADAKKGIAKIDKEEYDFAINVWYDGNYADDDSGVTPFKVEDEVTLKWDDLYVLKFENDDEITINFGTDNNEGEFEVDVSGQGKLLVNFNTKANEAIADANPGVKMYFVNFNGAKFNRTGTFEYEMDDMVSAYKVVDDKLVEINGLEISGDTATFSTNTLGNYVFADAELVNPVVEAAVEAPAATNPATGGK